MWNKAKIIINDIDKYIQEINKMPAILASELSKITSFKKEFRI